MGSDDDWAKLLDEVDSDSDDKKSKKSKYLDGKAGIYQKFFLDQHSNSHTLGWMIYVFSVICLIVGLGMVGGIWDSTPESVRTEAFKGYCYATWAVLALGIVLATIFVGYFYHVMRQFKIKSEKSLKFIFEKN